MPDADLLHIAIYRSVGIGDAVLATSCMDLLSKWNIAAKVYWLGREPVLSLMTSAFSNVIPVEIASNRSHAKNFRTILEIIPSCDIVLDLQKSFRSQLLCHRLAKRHGVRAYTWNKESFRRSCLVLSGYLRGRRKSLPSNLLDPRKRRHEMMAACLERALKERKVREKSLPANPRLAFGNEIPPFSWKPNRQSQTWLAVGPGALHPGKTSPPELFFHILEYVQKAWKGSNNLALVLLGDSEAQSAAQELTRRLRGWDVIDLCGKTSLEEAAQVLKEVKLFLTNDTALGHIAEAVGTAVAVLFGPTLENFGYSPFRPQSRAFSSHLGCRPCTKDGATNCRYGDRLCFLSIDASEVGRHIIDCLR